MNYSSSLQEKSDNLLMVLKASINHNNEETYANIRNDLETIFAGKGLVVFFGNGGSAAEATHLAAEFTGKCVIEHDPWPAISLNDSISALTGISNDFGFESVFERQIRAIGHIPMVLIGLSTSGNSKNVLEGLRVGKKLGARTYLFTSLKFKNNVDFLDGALIAETNSTPRAQEVHLFWGHSLAEDLEARLCR